MNLANGSQATAKKFSGESQEETHKLKDDSKVEIESKQSQEKVTARYTVVDIRDKVKRSIDYSLPNVRFPTKQLEDEVEELLDM